MKTSKNRFRLDPIYSDVSIQMGYRKLLKDYMRHIESVFGGNLVELASLTNALGKRDIGELRAIAAELKRESYTAIPSRNYNHLVQQLLREGKISFEQLNDICGIDPAQDTESISEEKFQRILLTLLDFSQQDPSSSH